MELLTATVKLRPSTYDDLAHWELGVKTTLSKNQFFVRMPDDSLQCYTLEQYSDKQLVKELMDDGRIYVFCGTSLVHDTDGVVTGIEVVGEAA